MILYGKPRFDVRPVPRETLRDGPPRLVPPTHWPKVPLPKRPAGLKVTKPASGFIWPRVIAPAPFAGLRPRVALAPPAAVVAPAPLVLAAPAVSEEPAIVRARVHPLLGG